MSQWKLHIPRCKYRARQFWITTACVLSSGLAGQAATAESYTEIPDTGDRPEWVIAIHGGAGNVGADELPTGRETELRKTLQASLAAGARTLASGGAATLAIEAALKILEDSPIFNAGRGAVLDEHGHARHDASIMRGEDHAAGAVAGSSRIRYPIAAARAVMEQTANVLLHGDGADSFALEAGLEVVEPAYFITAERREQWSRIDAQRSRSSSAQPGRGSAFGTVGAVALDTQGNLAAGTSTGGRSYKRYGRIGDSPIIGAGNYAANESCAVSATGHGEFFMRWTVARDICARVEFAGESLEAAAEALIVDTLLPRKGFGAVIALDPGGKVVFVSTTANLKRGVMSSGTSARVAVFADEDVTAGP